jgi:hypothetical protein
MVLFNKSLSIRCGIFHVNDLIENATWLWDRYIENEDMKILVGTHFYPVIRYDVAQLNEIMSIKRNEITLIS